MNTYNCVFEGCHKDAIGAFDIHHETIQAEDEFDCLGQLREEYEHITPMPYVDGVTYMERVAAWAGRPAQTPHETPQAPTEAVGPSQAWVDAVCREFGPVQHHLPRWLPPPKTGVLRNGAVWSTVFGNGTMVCCLSRDSARECWRILKHVCGR